jgi:hypothetical protein
VVIQVRFYRRRWFASFVRGRAINTSRAYWTFDLGPLNVNWSAQ